LNNFVQRTFSGAIYVVAVAGALFSGSLVFLFLFLIINILVMREFFIILEKGLQRPLNYSVAIVAGALLYLLLSLAFVQLIERQFIILALLLPIILMITELFKKNDNHISNITLMLFGVVYISIPLALLNLLFFHENQLTGSFPLILAGLFLVIWVNDTFSYLTGMLIGKHKLFVRISPKKTWEGTIGGFIFSIAAGVALFYLSGTLLLWQWIALSGLIAIAGDFGDLIESMIKRSFNIKDSGSIMPGHGGVLDRFDSLLVAAPVAVIFLTIINIL
jgi:phosphatidate cytidylyltransferase